MVAGLITRQLLGSICWKRSGRDVAAIHVPETLPASVGLHPATYSGHLNKLLDNHLSHATLLFLHTAVHTAVHTLYGYESCREYNSEAFVSMRTAMNTRPYPRNWTGDLAPRELSQGKFLTAGSMKVNARSLQSGPT